MTQAYPLKWPDGWPRTKVREHTSKFREARFDVSRRRLFDELRLLGAQNAVLSTNVPLRLDGMPYADAARRRMDDPGVAVYFTLRGKQLSMARDQFDTIHDNLRSLGLAIEYLRGLERHGGSNMLERAFSGFAALPPPSAPDVVDWREVFQFSKTVFPSHAEKWEIFEWVKVQYRNMAKVSHQDAGGSHEAMVRLNLALEAAKRELFP